MEINSYKDQLEIALQEQKHDNQISYEALVKQFEEIENEEEILKYIAMIREYVDGSKKLMDEHMKQIQKYGLARSDFFKENKPAFKFMLEVIK
jgi:hypothetical protein